MTSPALPTWLDREAYPFLLRRAPLPDGGLSYVDVGDGAPVLLSHSTPTWSFEWRHLVRALAPDHRCVAPDHLGFGLSDRPDGADYSPEAHARRFAAFADRLDLRDVTLVIHDYGGPIALPWRSRTARACAPSSSSTRGCGRSRTTRACAVADGSPVAGSAAGSTGGPTPRCAC